MRVGGSIEIEGLRFKGWGGVAGATEWKKSEQGGFDFFFVLSLISVLVPCGPCTSIKA